jgi:hypothetical protein
MGECNGNRGQLRQIFQDCEYTRIINLLKQLKPDKTSGRYRYTNAVPHIK